MGALQAIGTDPRSGKPVAIDVVDICRFSNGKLVEHWGVPDRFALLHQIGALPHRRSKFELSSSGSFQEREEMARPRDGTLHLGVFRVALRISTKFEIAVIMCRAKMMLVDATGLVRALECEPINALPMLS